ncbi:hypothetical protein [Sphingobacterium sp. LRF_L2]|uniref:hypothetical protein n=1 Tax=Sphingobacterium sp. LRF_L2 TaxID=3369421 RepID=UPI003F623850
MSFVKLPRLALFMGLQIEIWRNHIEESLFNDNAFMNHISDVDEDNIVGGKIVHIPQSGGGGRVVRNRTEKPATVRQRADDEVLYLIDEYTSDPVHISNADTKELSYDKRESVLREGLNYLAEETAEGVLENIVKSPVGNHNELPGTNILTTDNATKVGSAFEGGTGEYDAYKIGDLQRMKNFFKKQKAWKEGSMYALLTPDAETQMFPADSLVTATYMQSVTEEERRSGVMYKCQGWSLLSRSTVYRMTAAGVFVPYGAEGNEDDVEGNLFWNKALVEKAKGQTIFFDDQGNPTWYGDIYSYLVRLGARARRKAFEGVAVLRQKAA